jgi:AAA domain/RepB DNA-primase from phage plasmid
MSARGRLNTVIVDRLWSLQTGRYFFLATKSRSGKFREHVFKRSEIKKVASFIRDNSDQDIYFCPHGFTKPTRQKQYAVMPKMLWADLDEVDPRKITPKPTIAIESSPGRFVGLWFADKPVTEDLNRRLTYQLDADHGGWDLTQVLRVPGTVNYKYSSTPRVRLMWDDGPDWTITDIEKLLPEEQEAPKGITAREVFDRYERELPPWLRRELMATKTPPAGKRSEMIWKIEHALLEAGLSKDEAFVLIKASVWNKLRGRHSEDAQLRRELDKVVAERMKAGVESDRKNDAGDAKLLLSSGAFVDAYTPPDYLIDNVLQRRFLYSITGQTGAGKTSVLLRMAAHIALGLPIGGHDVERGNVTYFAGENPDDIRARWILLCEELGVDPPSMPVYFMSGATCDISSIEIRERIDAEAAQIGPLSLLIIDTSAAYFRGDEENSNTQMGDYARILRTFVDLPGGPAVIVACHPPKAAADNLVPRGGGAFLNEVDGNLAARKERDRIVAISTHGKFRGPEFSSFRFELVSGQSDKLVDTRGRHVWSVLAKPISENEIEVRNIAGRGNVDGVLREMLKHPTASIADLALACGFINKNGLPVRTKVQRILAELTERKLVGKDRNSGHHVLTTDGEKAAKALS